MTTVVGYSSIDVGTQYTLGAGDDIYVPRFNYVVSTDGTAIASTGGSHTATILGDVYGDVYGLQLGNDSTADFFLQARILAGASVSSGPTGSSIGVWIVGNDSEVYNEGSISGGYGILIGGTAVSNNQVINSGTITGDYYAVRHFIGSADTLRVLNTGTITGIATAASFSSEGGAVDQITNRGTMIGSIAMGGGNDVVDNRGGSIEGDIDLGAGNDVFDNRGGVVVGEVLGLDGNDSFRPGAGDEVINGGSGTDTLDFRGTGAVQVALDGSIDFTGTADGDEYISIESLYGSSFADLLIGNTSGNTIRGYAGADTISGGAGIDKIVGGSGADVLTGGAGNDQFIFDRLSDGGDVITDFGTTATNNDLIRIDAGRFGGGLATGALAATQFQSRADNVAQDADDRFIFRTSDRSLWFDIDGNGAEGPVLIADLQAGVVLTAADINLF